MSIDKQSGKSRLTLSSLGQSTGKALGNSPVDHRPTDDLNTDSNVKAVCQAAFDGQPDAIRRLEDLDTDDQVENDEYVDPSVHLDPDDPENYDLLMTHQYYQG